MNNYKYKFFLVLFFISIISMSQYETQEYELISNLDEIEIRYYPSSIMIKYIDDQNLNRGFKYLFRYISGGNDLNKKIEMTTPVHMERGDKNSSMEFVLPREFSYKNAPKPNDSKVNDQNRISTPFEAVKNGSDYLVIGRPITGSENPTKALEEINKEIL